MAFDMGFDFRSTLLYVVDPLYAVAVLGETYPHTYTSLNGDSINAGWDGGGINVLDSDNTNDPRIAGINYQTNSGVVTTFTIDLSSGSAPGAGNYLVDGAFGWASGGMTELFKILDNTTLLIDGTNGGPGYATAGDHYIDATLTDVAATTTWTGTAVSKTFATTTCKVVCNPNALATTLYTAVAHFRLTLATGASATKLRSMLMLMGVGA